MNVQQLIQQLAQYDGQTEVILATDEEGNSFYKVSVANLLFVPPGDDYWIEEVRSPKDILDEGEDLEGYEPRVVLWP